jgi:hypothetical protein
MRAMMDRQALQALEGAQIADDLVRNEGMPRRQPDRQMHGIPCPNERGTIMIWIKAHNVGR